MTDDNHWVLHEAGSLKRYTFADTGLIEGELRERVRACQEDFGVESEQLD